MEKKKFTKKETKLNKKDTLLSLECALYDCQTLEEAIHEGKPLPSWSKVARTYQDMAECIQDGINFVKRTKR